MGARLAGNLTIEQVEHSLGHRLEWLGFTRLKVGEVNEQDQDVIIAEIVTEDWVFSQAYVEGVPWNEPHWANPRFNELLMLSRAELDTAKRRGMSTEMQQLCSDDGGVLAPIFSNYVFAKSEKLAHDRMSADWDLNGIKCLERWWFAQKNLTA